MRFIKVLWGAIVNVSMQYVNFSRVLTEYQYEPDLEHLIVTIDTAVEAVKNINNQNKQS